MKINVADKTGNKFMIDFGTGGQSTITIEEIKRQALMADRNSNFDLGEGEKTEDNVELVLNGKILRKDQQLIEGIDFEDNATIVASAVSTVGGDSSTAGVSGSTVGTILKHGISSALRGGKRNKKHKRKVRKKTNKKLRISKSHNRKSGNRKKRKDKTRKHKTRKHKTRKHNIRKRY